MSKKMDLFREVIESSPRKRDAVYALNAWRVVGALNNEEYKMGEEIIKNKFEK
jgi:hypothetical protein